LLIDTEADHFKLTTARRGVLFDVDADGLSEQVAWTAVDSDDPWLAMDRNGNGRIDDGSELFGDATPKAGNRYDTTPNGFEALKYVDTEYYGPHVRDLLRSRLKCPRLAFGVRPGTPYDRGRRGQFRQGSARSL
jgi:hypothetical protein